MVLTLFASNHVIEYNEANHILTEVDTSGPFKLPDIFLENFVKRIQIFFKFQCSRYIYSTSMVGIYLHQSCLGSRILNAITLKRSISKQHCYSFGTV